MKKQISSEYSIVSLSKYTTPEIKEIRNKDWVFYGENHSYFQYLIDRYTGSTTNGAIINGVTRRIYGKGISALDANRKPEAYAQMLSLFKKKDLRRFIVDRKMLGMAAFQVSYEKGIVKLVSHFPMNMLAPEKMNEKGEIEAWYYHPKWAELKPSDKPTRISSFGFGNKKGNEIFVLQPYVAGYPYFPPVDYAGALIYASLEEEIADYLMNDTLNGFSGTKVINFNNGVPDEEKRNKIKNDVTKKLTGARGEKVIIAFNANKESATTIEDIPLNDAPAHYQYLADECRNKLIVAHSITSPMLVGVRESGGGLGNNADEIKTSSLLLDNIIVKPFQEEVIEVLDAILAVNTISLKLYFKSIQPLEFLDPISQSQALSLSANTNLLDELGEDESDDWELIDEREVDYDAEDALNAEIELLNNPKKSILSKIWKFVSTGTAIPNAKSDQDATIGDFKYKVRYQYTGSEAPEREFCKKMMSAKKLYRKEDIDRMSNSAVNAGWGPEGADNYDIFLYKGGGSCHHKWLRKTFRSTIDVDVNNPLAPTISTGKSEAAGFRVRNPNEVAMMPKDMPNQGFLPTNKRFS